MENLSVFKLNTFSPTRKGKLVCIYISISCSLLFTNLAYFIMINLREVFLRRKRTLRVREIIDSLGDNKHNATPQLIMEALNKDGDNVSLVDASGYLHLVLRDATLISPCSAYNWQPNRLRRLKYVVWKLGGVDRAKPDEILEAMRINEDKDYYLTVDDVKHNLRVHRDYLEQTWSGFSGPGRRVLDKMWPAPLVDDSDSLSKKMDEKLVLDENKISNDQLGGIGGPMRRALRGGDKMISNSWYKKKIDHMVTDLRSLTIGPN